MRNNASVTVLPGNKGVVLLPEVLVRPQSVDDVTLRVKSVRQKNGRPQKCYRLATKNIVQSTFVMLYEIPISTIGSHVAALGRGGPNQR